jgi:vacuolar-type H+-ATPase subunit E/Vma4
MSENTLIQKITTDADAQVAKVKADADAQVAALKRETDKKIADLQAEAKAVLHKKKQQLELVSTSQARQAANIALQAEKRKHINALFATVFTELVQQSSDEYVSYYVGQAKAVLPTDSHIVSVQAPESRSAETTKILGELNISTPVSAVATISAGLIIFTEDGVYDVSLDRIFAEKRAELEMVIVNEIVK